MRHYFPVELYLRDMASFLGVFREPAAARLAFQQARILAIPRAGAPMYSNVAITAAVRKAIADAASPFPVRLRIRLKIRAATLTIQMIGFNRARNNPRKI